MEFIERNYLDTTSMMTINNGTDTAAYIFDQETRLQFVSDGDNDDTTYTTIHIAFDETKTVDRIALLDHNAKDFTIFYNGLTANTFIISNPTTTTDFANNSATSLYLQCTSQECTSVTLDIKGTMVANSEKAVGLFWVSQQKMDFSQLASAKGYKPLYKPKQFKHTLSDGGIRLHTVAQKYDASIKLKYVNSTFRASLRSVYDEYESFGFVPFGTGTSWDGVLKEVVWSGNWDGDQWADDADAAGYNISIRLNEVTK